MSHFGGCKWGYLAFGRKETGAKRVTMATTLRVEFVSFVMDIYGAKFQEHCFNNFRDIVIQFLPFFSCSSMTSSLI